MTVVGEAFVEIRPKTDDFAPDLSRDVDKAVSKADHKVPLTGELDQERTRPNVLAGVKALAAAAGGAFVVKEIFDFGKQAVADAEESRKVAAQTEAAIKSTGGAAKVTAADIDRLSSSISRKTAIDDEAIQSGANLLLTFTNVKNEAGAGNDIFNRATSTLTDMAAALGTDVSGGAIQLGKALNDPIKGVAALGEVGVTFTDEQKEMIKTMTEAGNVAGAQGIILDELGKEFGGSAEAQATAGAKLGVTFGNIREELGTKLLPIVDKVATFLADRLPGALEKAGKFVAPFVDLISDIARTLTGGGDHGAGLIVDFAGLFGIMEDDSRLEPFFSAMEQVENVLGSVIAFVRDNFKPILLGLALVISPIGVVVAGLAFLFVKHFDEIQAVVGPVIGFVIERFEAVRAFAEEIFPQVQEAVGHAFVVIQAVVGGVVDFIGAAWRLFGDDILKVAGAVFSQLGAIVEFAMTLVQNIIRLVLAVINGDWGKAWDAIQAIFSGAIDLIVSTMKNLGGILLGLAGAAFDLLRRGVEVAVPKIIDFVKGIPGQIVDSLATLGSLLLGLGGDLIDGFVRGIKNAAGRIVSAIKEAITDKLPSFVKNALGISSPSRVFMALGEQVSLGFAAGIAGAGGAPRAAMSDLLAVGAASVPGFGGVGSAGGGRGGAGALIHIDRFEATERADVTELYRQGEMLVQASRL